MERTNPITRELFIRELELPAQAELGEVTTLALGEECEKGGGGTVTTLAIGEEACKGK